ncbi:endo alpha-1,4 polygalactosaminidase [Microbacterium sp. SLBN-111]|uniref:endo alpha-1,4 polygalactosaminidase n=1 Tax=Microbacterium sp. SLBN-111 TaxID=3377733 RepID=UPI003C76375E
MPRALLLAGVTALVLALTACAPAESTPPDGSVAFPVGARVDYQLGEPYAPAEGVGLVVRDRTADPADGVYSVCYVNAFQTQPGESAEWPEGTLLERDGRPVIDPDWPDERLVDTSTAEKRDRVVEHVAPWIRGCAASGFRAVEFDNLDTFTRTDGALTLEDNAAVAAALVTTAHEAGLAAGQKNAAEFARELRDAAGFDFAVAEECAAFDECGTYTDVYGSRVIDIEYSDQLPRSFADMCADETTPATTVLRDRRLSAPGSAEYVFATCPEP